MFIDITPVTVWTPTGLKSASRFEVRYVNYQNGPAIADCHLWTADEEVSSLLVGATEAQCSAWTDDATFYAVLAANAGLAAA